MDNMEIARLVNALVGGGCLSDQTERERYALLQAAATMYSGPMFGHSFIEVN